ncbi:proline--tRNA ligase [Lysinibacillus telephonicus]|uniref:Proline--tRNA ligase n=1 Tax=Lysinibacillus telephonicus TaxID=1714840 RepID=A0A431UW37_9BACI|nr:proline--tRNA ligase [Lysinibacillus telephonicus]RTQ95243.1 proline--tRNA ligase [Lysinibacillus telephonicus]
MKQSLTLIPTMREVPSEVEARSHKMLLRAGFIRQSTSGVYSYLPLAKRVLTKIEKMIQQEMESLGAIEIYLPIIQPVEIWEQSNRYENFGKELMHFNDRSGRHLLLSPAHEEAVTMLVQEGIKSYKKLPLILFQIQTKFRDEIRPRYGLLRSREFIMKDAYSFHANNECLENTYNKMVQAYSSILYRVGINYRIVQADSGIIGGASAEEFIVPSEEGEAIIAFSDQSNYAANIEVAEVVDQGVISDEHLKSLEKIATPDVETMEDVCAFLNMQPSNCIKSLLFKADDKYVVVLVRGNHKINEIKLRKVLHAKSLCLANEKEIQQLLGCSAGSIGPIKLPVDVKVIADLAIQSVRNSVAGANEDGYHYIHVNPERDFAINSYEDIRYIQEGDPSPDGNGSIRFEKGIEVGHIFKQGTTFSETFNANFVDDNGESKPIIMGSYGFGITRLLAVVADKYQDEHGFIWPKQLAPYDIHLMPTNSDDDVQLSLANELYNILTFYRFEVLFDDRNESAGVKFADADLIGLPVRVTIGKKASEGIVEVKIRSTGETFEWAKEELVDHLNEFFRSN